MGMRSGAKAPVFMGPLAVRLKPCPDSNLRGEGKMPSHPSKPKTLAGDPGSRQPAGPFGFAQGRLSHHSRFSAGGEGVPFPNHL